MSAETAATLLSHTDLTDDLFYLTFNCSLIANESQPGQFVNVLLNSDQFTLRRPFAVAQVDKAAGTFGLLIRRVGNGTEYLSTLKPGTEMSVLGPLGHGWEFDSDDGSANICVSGGVGLAPILNLACELSVQDSNRLTALIVGVRSKQEVAALQSLLDGAKLTDNVHFVSDDGAYGGGLNPAQYLGSPEIGQLVKSSCKTNVYICGPTAMTAACVQVADKLGYKAQVSLEERMACGFGVCLGCVVDTKQGQQRVCKDGPVFRAKDLLWN